MAIHTTNYTNTFIEVANDCPVKTAELPLQKKEEKTIATLQLEMIIDSPYKYTSDEVLFSVFAERNKIHQKDFATEKERFFSKGQPCFRASPLPKRYGWGVHSNAEGRIAVYAVESEEYKRLTADKDLMHTKAMNSTRNKMP